MAPSIESLSDHQAIQALKLFYDYSPDQLWEGGRKPPPERFRSLASDLQDEAPAEYSRFVNLLLDDSPVHAPARAALCRQLLGSFQQSAALRPYADPRWKPPLALIWRSTRSPGPFSWCWPWP